MPVVSEAFRGVRLCICSVTKLDCPNTGTSCDVKDMFWVSGDGSYIEVAVES